MATLREVADRAGVHVMTVSRAVTSPERLAPSTLARIQSAIDELGYVPNSIARGLRTKRMQAIAVVVSGVQQFALEVLLAVSSAARTRGYAVVIGNSESSTAIEREQLEMLINRQVDGVVLYPHAENAENVRLALDRGLPAVVFGVTIEDCPVDQVRCDSREGTRVMTEHLLALGHREIRMLTGPTASPSAIERRMGFEDALADHGIGTADRSRSGAFSRAAGEAGARRFLADHPETTAIVTANPAIAAGVRRAAEALGVHVPGSLSIVTIHDVTLDEAIWPFFTGSIEPVTEMAETAMLLLIERLNGDRDRERQEVVFDSVFELRESTAPPAQRPT